MTALAPLAGTAARRHWNAIAELCAADDPADPLPELSRRLARIVPFDAGFWAAADPLTGLATSPAMVQNLAPECCRPYWEQEFGGGDYLLFGDLARGARPVGTLEEATGGRPARSGRHRMVIRPSGLDAELRVAFVRGGCVWGVAALYRQEGRAGFSAEEADVVASLVPVVADGLRARTLGVAAAATSAAPLAPGLLIFDEAGRVRSMNDAAEEWLRLLPPDPYGAAGTSESVSTEVLTVVHRARAVNGLWVVIHGSCLSASDGGAGEVAVVIEPAKGSEMAPIIAEAFALTGREQEITQAVARGEPTGEIAVRLHLSPHTVRDHLKAIFEKTGVRSRGELVARLFSDHYLPQITGPDGDRLHV